MTTHDATSDRIRELLDHSLEQAFHVQLLEKRLELTNEALEAALKSRDHWTQRWRSGRKWILGMWLALVIETLAWIWMR